MNKVLEKLQQALGMVFAGVVMLLVGCAIALGTFFALFLGLMIWAAYAMLPLIGLVMFLSLLDWMGWIEYNEFWKWLTTK